jgi:hypothetical protein
MNTEFQAFIKKEFMWRLDKDARTVTGVVFTSTCTPVLHLFKYGEGVGDNLVRFVAFNIGHEPNTTCIMLEGRRI